MIALPRVPPSSLLAACLATRTKEPLRLEHNPLPTLPPSRQAIEGRLLERQDALGGPRRAQRSTKAQAAAMVAATQQLANEQLPAIQLVTQVGAPSGPAGSGQWQLPKEV